MVHVQRHCLIIQARLKGCDVPGDCRFGDAAEKTVPLVVVRVRRSPRGRAGDIDPAPVALCMHTHTVTAQQGMSAAGVAYKWKKLKITREYIKRPDKKFIG